MRAASGSRCSDISISLSTPWSALGSPGGSRVPIQEGEQSPVFLQPFIVSASEHPRDAGPFSTMSADAGACLQLGPQEETGRRRSCESTIHQRPRRPMSAGAKRLPISRARALGSRPPVLCQPTAPTGGAPRALLQAGRQLRAAAPSSVCDLPAADEPQPSGARLRKGLQFLLLPQYRVHGSLSLRAL